MILAMPKSLVEWTNLHWPDLAKVGGLESVTFRLVDRLPFGSDAAAMTWRGDVLVRRAWVAPALSDERGTLNPRHMWALAILACHEPLHVIEQSKRSWLGYLARYVWAWATSGGYRGIPEERAAYANQAHLLELWRSDPSMANSATTYWRPS